MMYYRPVKEVRDPVTGWQSIRGELLTSVERKKYFKGISDKCFEKVVIPKSKTFFSFGVRLESYE